MTVEPWNKSLRQRVSALKNGTHRVAYFAPKPDAGSFRYRCYNTSQSVNAYSTQVSASYFYLSDLSHLSKFSDIADTLVVFRTPYDTDVHRVISEFRRAGKRVLFDIDDLVFDVDFAPLVTSNLNYKLFGKDIDQWFAFIANIGACMKLCDGVVTTNPFIEDRARSFSDLPVTVVPNFLNEEQIKVSVEARNRKTPPPGGAGLRLGYFSGSHSHAKDFAAASGEISHFLESSPGSTLTVLGHLELPEELLAFGGRVTRQPFMNFQDLQHAVASVDVNLVPLQMSPFTFSKSELKYFEAAVVDTLTLASPTPLFSKVITHGETGFLAAAGQWASELRDIEALPLAQRESMAGAAREHALRTYSPASMVATLEALFLGEGNLTR